MYFLLPGIYLFAMILDEGRRHLLVNLLQRPKSWTILVEIVTGYPIVNDGFGF